MNLPHSPITYLSYQLPNTLLQISDASLDLFIYCSSNVTIGAQYCIQWSDVTELPTSVSSYMLVRLRPLSAAQHCYSTAHNK